MAISTWPIVEPVQLEHGPPQGQWTVADYLRLPSNERRYEVIDGVIRMAPAPNLEHQRVVGDFYVALRQIVLSAQLGEVLISPVDVELGPNIIVQPDVMVVLDAHKDRMTPDRIVGAPDLVVEVASPGTATYDRHVKQNAYAAAGVSEYWIVDPIARALEVLVLEDGVYRLVGVFGQHDVAPSLVLPPLPPTREFFPKS